MTVLQNSCDSTDRMKSKKAATPLYSADDGVVGRHALIVWQGGDVPFHLGALQHCAMRGDGAEIVAALAGGEGLAGADPEKLLGIAAELVVIPAFQPLDMLHIGGLVEDQLSVEAVEAVVARRNRLAVHVAELLQMDP